MPINFQIGLKTDEEDSLSSLRDAVVSSVHDLSQELDKLGRNGCH